jgi:lipopolysaccharide/colanic/teichoic acid biosynthesis glycosyltransferase
MVDILAAAAVLVVTAPVFAVLTLVNYATSGQPFFRQTRLGRGLRPFVLLKFQTMVGGAGGSTVTVAGDARITPYGRVLRALKLDELPQFLNVLRGEMSLVGPRPLTPNEVAAVPAEVAAAVYRVRPGVTGISALAFADEERQLARWPEPERVYFACILPGKMALELAYRRRRTWLTDLAIVVCTPLAPVAGPLRRRLVARLVPAHQPPAGLSRDRVGVSPS